MAASGIIRIRGEKNTMTAKRTATTILVRPVLPPASTPDVDSTKVVMVVLPVYRLPPLVPDGIYQEGSFWIPGMFPSSSSMPALPATPSTVPSVEKKSPQKAMNTYI